ncbi:MAG: 8-amino-7-oxononanoate synthase [Hahellaceae bacterium]|nr:8-amino-7-oxononanoate synthase [Hahellaceae bacterium]
MGLPDWRQSIEARKAQGLYRQRLCLESAQGPLVTVQGEQVLAFCSNDYLGLASDSRLVDAASVAMSDVGFGAGASHLVIGHHRYHHQLEEALADFTGREAALLFSTGYSANLGVLSALCDRGDTVVEDKLNHASLLDGARLSGARLLRFQHNDTGALKARLDQGGGQTLVAVDGVFSMDGDLAPLPEQVAACEAAHALLMVDDAHGLGVLGRTGRGTLEHYGLDASQVPILMGTLGKALGTSGAFVAGSRDLIDMLVQFARPYIYTTAMPPLIAAATLKSLEIVAQEPWRRAHLQHLIHRFRQGALAQGWRLMSSHTPIQPIQVGTTEAALALSDALRQRGILVTAIRPPTVPVGSSRLRITLTAAHTEAQVDQLLGALEDLAPAWAGSSQMPPGGH